MNLVALVSVSVCFKPNRKNNSKLATTTTIEIKQGIRRLLKESSEIK